ncbi:fimbrial protein [Serratia fonticola]
MKGEYMLEGLFKSPPFYLCATMIIVGLSISFPSFGTNSSAIINISGTVLSAPSCIINEHNIITVDFGRNISSLRINGSNYIRSIDYSLVCKNNYSNSMKIMIEGTGASFNNRALSTTLTDLAISIIVNGQQQDINSWTTFSYPIKPVLQAVLIKRSGVQLPAGDFSAGATLRVDYQ